MSNTATAEIDSGILPDDAMTLTELAKIKGKHVATIFRWITAGLKGVDGQVHKLPAFKDCGRYIVSRSAYRDWLRNLNSTSPADVEPESTAPRDDEFDRRAQQVLGEDKPRRKTTKRRKRSTAKAK